MNDISIKINQIQNESFYLDKVDKHTSLDKHLSDMEKLIWQVRGMLRVQEVKQKTWDQKVENQVVQLEQESSTHNNDQKSQEKEQSQRTVKTNDISLVRIVQHLGGTLQYILYCPSDSEEQAHEILGTLTQSGTAVIPGNWELKVNKL